MKPFSECTLYAFVDTAYLHGRNPEVIATELCRGEAEIIQIRAKGSSKAEVLDIAKRIEPITTANGVWLVINDYPDVASEVGAPLCHLGQEDFFDAGHLHVSEIRTVSGRLKIGLSSHAPLQAERAVAAGAEYVAIGPVWPTGTKPGAKPVTLDYVRWASANVKIPWFAIGGITLQNVSEVLAAGATRICVVSAILNSPDVAKTCKEFKDRLTSAGR